MKKLAHNLKSSKKHKKNGEYIHYDERVISIPKNVVDKDLYARVSYARRKLMRGRTSAYSSLQLSRVYQELGGKYKGKKTKSKGLHKWLEEKWVDIARPKKNGKGYEPCGRPDADFDIKDYPKCLPAKLANKLTRAEARKAVKEKRRAMMSALKEYGPQDIPTIYVKLFPKAGANPTVGGTSTMMTGAWRYHNRDRHPDVTSEDEDKGGWSPYLIYHDEPVDWFREAWRFLETAQNRDIALKVALEIADEQGLFAYEYLSQIIDTHLQAGGLEGYYRYTPHTPVITPTTSPEYFYDQIFKFLENPTFMEGYWMLPRYPDTFPQEIYSLDAAISILSQYAQTQAVSSSGSKMAAWIAFIRMLGESYALELEGLLSAAWNHEDYHLDTLNVEFEDHYRAISNFYNEWRNRVLDRLAFRDATTSYLDITSGSRKPTKKKNPKDRSKRRKRKAYESLKFSMRPRRRVFHPVNPSLPLLPEEEEFVFPSTIADLSYLIDKFPKPYQAKAVMIAAEIALPIWQEWAPGHQLTAFENFPIEVIEVVDKYIDGNAPLEQIDELRERTGEIRAMLLPISSFYTDFGVGISYIAGLQKMLLAAPRDTSSSFINPWAAAILDFAESARKSRWTRFLDRWWSEVRRRLAFVIN